MSFIERIFTDFSEIHGDRAFGDDPAMLCGMARFEGKEVMVIGNLKGRSTKEKVLRKKQQRVLHGAIRGVHPRPG